MSKQDKKTIFTLVLILGYVVHTNGFAAGVNFVKQVIGSIALYCNVMVAVLFQFPDELGLTDWLWTNGIYLAITVGAAGLAGYAFTSREKKKLLGIISSLVSLVSLMFTFS